MINQKNLHHLRSIVDMSHEDLERFHRLWPTEISAWEYFANKAFVGCGPNLEQVRHFCDAYRLVADSSWPTVDAIEDFYDLPELIQHECRTVHNFAPEIWFNENDSYDSWHSSGLDSYPLYDVIRAHYVLNQNYDLIHDKTVLDFPCHYGNLAFWMGKFDFKHLTLADVRSEALNMADEYMRLTNLAAGKWSTVQADLHNLSNNTKLCAKFDTLLLAGVLYHIHDHFDVLRSITASGIPNIIIETAENCSIMDSPDPLIWWQTENTKLWQNGFVEDQSSVMVGLPNFQWIERTMQFLGYSRNRPAKYFPSMCIANVPLRYGRISGEQGKSGVIRSVHVFCKNT